MALQKTLKMDTVKRVEAINNVQNDRDDRNDHVNESDDDHEVHLPEEVHHYQIQVHQNHLDLGSSYWRNKMF